MHTRVCDLFGIELPIFAFSNSRAVCAAVSRAGGMGIFGALPYSPGELGEHLRWLDDHVEGRPYGVDVVMPAAYAGRRGPADGQLDRQALSGMIPEGHRRFVEDLLARHEVPPLPAGERPRESLIAWTHETTRPQVEVALGHPIRLLVNALGPPPPDVIERAHERGVLVGALTGSVRHARKHVEAGVDLIIAQGNEAGGHTGEISTMVLVPEVIDAVRPTPVLAAGGIGCGRQVAAALALGADGVWTGSIWLTASEDEVVGPIVKDKLLRASSADTVRSRALSGKPARQLRTAWTEAWDAPGSPGPLPLPLQYMATAEAHSRIRRHAGHAGNRASELLGTPVGQIVGRMDRIRPAAEILRELADECTQVVEQMIAHFPQRGGGRP